MAPMTMEKILDRVAELKQEASEKDEVIRVQQSQIDEFEQRVKELEKQVSELQDTSSKAEELLEKLSQALDA